MKPTYYYTTNEAKRRAWVKRITELKTQQDSRLRDELLQILTTAKKEPDTITMFESRRDILLSKNHGQGLSWQAHSGFWWRLVKILIGFFVKISLTESPLRTILKENILTQPSDHAVKKDIDKPESTEDLTDEQFEDLMYEAPKEAIQRVESKINSLIQQKNDDRQQINTALDRLYASQLLFNPIDYFNNLQKIAHHAPTQTLSFLYQFYDKNNEQLNEHQFVELHLIAKILMDHAVCCYESTAQRINNINKLLVLMNATSPTKTASGSHPIQTPYEPPVDHLMRLLSTSEETLSSALETLYEEHSQQTIDAPAQQTFQKVYRFDHLEPETMNQKPSDALKAQFKCKDRAPITPLIYYFSRLATEQLLLDRLNSPYQALWNIEGQQGLGTSTIQSISENLLETWQNQSLTTLMNHDEIINTSTGFLSPTPKVDLFFSSFKDIEHYWVAQLIFDLKIGINTLVLAQKTIMSRRHNQLTENQIAWILQRLEHHFPKDTRISELQDLFTLQKTWITPLLEMIENNNREAQDQITQNLKLLKQGSTHLTEIQQKIIANLLPEPPYLNQDTNAPIINILRELSDHLQPQDTSTLNRSRQKSTIERRISLVGHSIYSSSSRQNSLSQLSVATNTQDAENQHETCYVNSATNS